MHLFALDPWWSDFYAVGGFVVGVLGLAVGFAGFGYTIYQVRKVKVAALAAEEAAKRTLAESKASYERFVGGYTSRLLSELRNAEAVEDWKLAVVRCHDLAELLGTLAVSRQVIGELSRELRDFGQKFTRRASGEKPKFSQQKWARLLTMLHEFLDQLNTPFRESQHGPVSPNNPAGQVPGNRTNALGEDQGEAGELGEEPEG